jgi:aminoglycoside phosphotransferase (APT) family kinase protein
MPSPHPLVVRWAGASSWRPLKLKDAQQTWLVRTPSGRAILKTTTLSWYGGGLLTEEVVLPLAARHDLPVPSLLDVGFFEPAGVFATLTSVLPGESALPARAPRRRLRALGAAAALIHAVPLASRPGLPPHDRPVPYDPYVASRREGSAATTPLLDEADRAASAVSPPASSSVLVHGDYHLANTMWVGDTLTGFIDWDTAGVGHPGIDLGWARFDAALRYPMSAVDEIQRGWTEATGREPEQLAYWDAVAALQSDADIGPFTEARDAFLRHALARL